MTFRLFMFFSACLTLSTAQAYQSGHDLIQWDQRGNDRYYCSSACQLSVETEQQSQVVDNKIENGHLHSHIVISGAMCLGFDLDCHTYVDFNARKKE